MENLFLAWQEFRRGKRKKIDVQNFEFNLEDNLFKLYLELKHKIYRHSSYKEFYVTDPKLRHIHKANICDRVLHHAIFRFLYPIFDKDFIHDSYSCRLRKGTHRAIKRLERFVKKVSKNNKQNLFALKCDIKKFFDSVDHAILRSIIKNKVKDEDAVWLINEIVKSFSKDGKKGLPLGNVTSQLFANIYLNKFDQFVKHDLKIKYYIRYCDDFIVLDQSRDKLVNLVRKFDLFLKQKLNLFLHADKIIIRKYHQGLDFLGFVAFPYHRVLRTRTKKRILRKILQKKQDLNDDLISEFNFSQSIQSYLGILKHCNGYKIKKEIEKILKK